MSKEVSKKRVNIYVEVEKYDRFKKLLDIMGITVTDFFDESMTNFLDQMEAIVQNQDKDAFLKMMSRNIDDLQRQVEEELKK